MSSPDRPSRPNPEEAPAGPSSQAGVAIDDPPSVELHHSRAPTRGRFAWLRIGLPLFGLLLVPAVGLVYTATASFGPGSADAADSAEVAGAEDGKPGAKKGKKTKAPKGVKPRTDGAAACCAELRELGKTAPIDQRGVYLAAAQACDAAPDEDRAMRVVKSNVKGAKLDVPAECGP